MSFVKATKAQAKLRLALQGPSGGGKTYSALAIACALGDRVAVIDSEHGSAAKYADKFSFDTAPVTDDYNPNRYIDLMKQAAEAGYDVLVVDSLTHAWNGPGGFLDLVDQECKRMLGKGQKADSFAAWKNVTPVYNRLIQAILSCKAHVICTLRAKQEYEKTKDDNGRVQVKKVGMAPEIRDNFQYELDIEGMLDMDHNLVIGKTRCPALDGKVFNKPGKEFAAIVKSWLSDGAEVTTVDTTDYRAECRALYAKLGKDVAEPIRAKHGEDWKAMHAELKALA